jgi:hypothetical protein
MFKKIKEFLFGKPVVKANAIDDAAWAKAKELSDALTAVAVKKEAMVEIETKLTVAPTPTKKKRTFVKREPKAAPPAQWPFPAEKPSEGVTLAELEALNVEPIPTPAMKVRKPRKAAVVPKQD